MFLFLLLAVPAWIYLVVSFYPVPSRGWRGLLIPIFGGIVAAMALISVTLGLLTRNPFGTDLSVLYSWAWYRGPGWPLTVLTAGLGIYYHLRPTSYSRIRQLACWFSGAVFVYTVWYALTPQRGFDEYRLFLAPFVWTGAAGMQSWLLDRGLRIDGWMKWLFYAAALAFPSILTFVPVLQVLGPEVVAWILGVLVAFGALFLIFLDSRGRLS